MINGRHVRPGTVMSVRGERGKFRFVEHVLTDTEESFTVYGGQGYKPALPFFKQTGHAQFRSFRTDHTFRIHQETTP